MGEIGVFEAGDVDAIFVGRDAGAMEGVDAADFTEIVFGGLGMELVQG